MSDNAEVIADEMDEESVLGQVAETDEVEPSNNSNEADDSTVLDSTTDEINNTVVEADEENVKEEVENTNEQENVEMQETTEACEDGDAGEEKEDDGKDLGEEEEDDVKSDKSEEEEEDEEEEVDPDEKNGKVDTNVMPQVNVTVLAKRRWQVKVYPLKPADFTSGAISRVFKSARESLLYLMTGKFSRGKGEMYIQSVTESARVVRSLMTLDSHFQEINIEIIRKNSEGGIQEKAYMRFDTRMVRMLFVPPQMPFRPRGGRGGSLYGRKRERVIGSVFVKNLPPGTTKNMLKVMFPFAQEINYNPEKYSECTARLVMKARNSVIPCLKAFAKVELGGNILELHPLEKKTRPAYPKSESRRRSTSQNADKEGNKTDGSAKSDSKSEDGKKETTKSKEQVSKSGDAKEEKDSPKKKESSTPSSKKSGDFKSPQPKGKDKNEKHPGQGKNRPGPYKGRGASTRGASTRGAGRGNKDFSNGTRKSFGDFKKPGVAGSRFSGSRGGLQQRDYAGSSHSFGSRGRGSRGISDRSGMNVGSELMAKAEATKDMMVLQSQLNMAIKSQLAVLNQTKMAVEQAKRGASSIGMGNLGVAGASGGSSYGLSQQLSERSRRELALDRDYVARSTSRDRVGGMGESSSWGYGGKRSAGQADLDEYGDAGYGRKRTQGARPRGGTRGGARGSSRGGAARGSQYGTGNRQVRGGQNRQQQRVAQYQQQQRAAQNRAAAVERAVGGYDDDLYRQDSYADDPYGYGMSARSYSSAAATLSGRSASYDNDYYERY